MHFHFFVPVIRRISCAFYLKTRPYDPVSPSFSSGHPFSQGYAQAEPKPSVKDYEPENSHQKAAC